MIILLIIMVVLSYYFFNKSLTRPTQISLYIFLVGSIVCAYGLESSWTAIEFSGYGVIVIIVSLALMLCGELFGEYAFNKKMATTYDENISVTSPLSNKVVIVNNSLCFVAFLLYLRRLLVLATNYGYSGENFLFYVRLATLKGERNGFVISFLITWCKISSYLYTYFFIKSIFLEGINKAFVFRWQYLIGVVISFLIDYISAAKYNFIKSFSYSLLCGLLLYKNIKRQDIKLRNLCAIGGGIISVTVILFFAVGEARSSFNNNSGFDELISYMGSSIALLDQGVLCPELNQSNLFAGLTFNGLWSTLSRFGFEYSESSKFLDFMFLNQKLSSNVYTMQYNLLKDFGFLGLIDIEFLVGFVYGYFYRVCLMKKNDMPKILYCYFSYNLILQLWNPTMFQEMFTLTWFLEICLIVIFNQYISKSRNCDNVRRLHTVRSW